MPLCYGCVVTVTLTQPTQTDTETQRVEVRREGGRVGGRVAWSEKERCYVVFMFWFD